jgi:hypothetical protein
VQNVETPIAIDKGGRQVFLITNEGLTIVDMGSAPPSIGHLSSNSGAAGTQIRLALLTARRDDRRDLRGTSSYRDFRKRIKSSEMQAKPAVETSVPWSPMLDQSKSTSTQQAA